MEPLKFRWQKMIASVNGPDSPTTRHVLLTLSLFMDNDGGSCFPSNRTLATAAKLHRKSVASHLESASKAGWIQISGRAGDGRGWKRHSYKATFPDDAGKEAPHVNGELGESGSPPQGGRGERRSLTWGKRFPLILIYHSMNTQIIIMPIPLSLKMVPFSMLMEISSPSLKTHTQQLKSPPNSKSFPLGATPTNPNARPGREQSDLSTLGWQMRPRILPGPQTAV